MIKEKLQQIKELEDYVFSYFNSRTDFPIEDNTNSFWNIDTNTLYWTDEYDQDYEEDILGGHIYRKDDFTAVVIDLYAGTGAYLVILDNSKERTEFEGIEYI